MPDRRLLTVEEVWRRYDAVESRLTAPVSERMLDLAGLAPGMRVLDLATGRGEPAIRAARRIGPTGSVLGVDASEALLRMAREQADLAGVSNLELRAAEAESLAESPDESVASVAACFDAATVRWGLMYMTSPVAVLTAARRALIPGGVLVAAFWAERDRVPCVALPRRLLERYRSLPPIDPEAPGMFRYADPLRIARDFGLAGFAIEHSEEMDIPVIEAESGAELVTWVRDALGFTRLLNDLSDDDQRRWEDDLMREAELLRGEGDGAGAGPIRLGGVTRIVVARTEKEKGDEWT